ncbi:nucleotidyltransferase family protein [Candidatus Sumerlaeota bacterium]
MAEEEDMDLLEELTELVSKLEAAQIEFALCGGLAMAVYAFPRATLDIDIMIEPESLPRAKQVASDLGFSLDAGLMEFKNGAVQLYRLCKMPPESADELVLDLVLITPETQEAWDSRRKIDWERGAIPVVSPEGLIKLKSMRNSGQDQDDILHLRKLLDEE